MSRYGTVIGGSANARTVVAQGSDVESLGASIIAALSSLVAIQPPLVDPTLASISIAGSGDGHMFFVEFTFGSAVNVDGGLVVSSIAPLLAATAEDLQKQIGLINTTSPIVDMQLAGGAKGQRVMALVIAGTLNDASGGCSCVTWRPDGLGDVTTFEQVMAVVAAAKGPTTIFCPQISQPLPEYVINPGPAPATPVVYDMKGSSFVSPRGPHDAIQIQIRRGATLLNLARIAGGVRLQANKNTGDPKALDFTTIDPSVSAVFVVEDGAELHNNADAQEPMITVGPVPTEFYLVFNQEGTAISLSGAGAPAVAADVGSILNINVLSGGLSLDTIQPSNWMGSRVGSTVNWIHDGTMAFTSNFWTGYHPNNLGTNFNQPTGCVGGTGPTAFRPVFQGGGQPGFGCMYFDLDLAGPDAPGKPIWYNGNGATGWVDATGTAA